MAIGLALGGTDEQHWLYLALAGGRGAWSRVIDPDEPIMLQELFAASPSGDDLSHPGDVPLPGETTLAAVLAMIEDELGAKARVIDLRLRLLSLPAVTFLAHDERSVRLEAASDDAFAPRLARLGDAGAATWGRVLAALRHEALTEQYLRVSPTEDDGVDVRTYASFVTFELDDPAGSVRLRCPP